MAETTKIAWTDSTFNPWRGCTKVSEGCKFCYAERGSGRNPKVLGVWGPKGTRVLASDAHWSEPERWNRDLTHDSADRDICHRVFCASLADVFEDWDGQMTDSQGRSLFLNPHANWTGKFVTFSKMEVPDGTGRPYTLDDARKRLWALIRRTPRLTWQLLTKRPENIRRFMPHGEWPNVWLGTSVEDNSIAPFRIDPLLEVMEVVRVPVRFVSAEPLLEPLDLLRCLGPDAINWVIVGGESGSKARPFRFDWARHLISQCDLASVACFVKQGGSNVQPSFRDRWLPLFSYAGKADDPNEWRADVKVQNFPRIWG